MLTKVRGLLVLALCVLFTSACNSPSEPESIRPTVTRVVASPTAILEPTILPPPMPTNARNPTPKTTTIQTDSPLPTRTPVPMPTPTPTNTPPPTNTITPAPTPTPPTTPTNTPLPTNTPVPTPTPVPAPTPTNTPLPTNTPVPTPTPVPAPTPTNTPLPTGTPIPTPTLAPTPTAKPEPDTGQWEFSKYIEDPIDDSVLIFLTLEATTGDAPNYYQRNSAGTPPTPILYLVCERGDPLAFISWKLLNSPWQENVVSLRLGSQPATTDSWIQYNSRTLYPGDTVEFMKQLTRSTHLIARTDNKWGGFVTAEFDLTGLAEAAKPLTEDCFHDMGDSQARFGTRDRLISFGATATNPKSNTGSWITAEINDVIDDSKTLLLGTRSTDGNRDLVFSCRDGELSAQITQIIAGLENLRVSGIDFVGSHSREVIWRIGHQPPERDSWLHGSGHLYIYPGDPVEFIKQLSQTDRFIFRDVAPRVPPIRTFWFPVGGLTDAAGPLTEACGLVSEP